MHTNVYLHNVPSAWYRGHFQGFWQLVKCALLTCTKILPTNNSKAVGENNPNTTHAVATGKIDGGLTPDLLEIHISFSDLERDKKQAESAEMPQF